MLSATIISVAALPEPSNIFHALCRYVHVVQQGTGKGNDASRSHGHVSGGGPIGTIQDVKDGGLNTRCINDNPAHLTGVQQVAVSLQGPASTLVAMSKHAAARPVIDRVDKITAEK